MGEARVAMRRAILFIAILSAGCAGQPPASNGGEAAAVVNLGQAPCGERAAAGAKEPPSGSAQASWLDSRGSLRMEFELEGVEHGPEGRATQIEVASALRARLREAGIPRARVSWMNFRQVVIDIPPDSDQAAIERAREGIRAPGLPVKLVYTVEATVGPAVP
jgi:hypothetical protein